MADEEAVLKGQNVPRLVRNLEGGEEGDQTWQVHTITGKTWSYV
jgi:hypothetical protein